MALIKFEWQPSATQLRQFGLIGAAACILLGIWNQLHSSSAWLAIIVVAASLTIIALLKPTVLRLPYLLATLITYPIGLILGELLLLCVFILVFVPIALILRLLGRDALHRRWQPEQDSFWIPVVKQPTARDYFRQF